MSFSELSVQSDHPYYGSDTQYCSGEPLTNVSSILIAADSACVAYRVERLIGGEFDSVHRSTQPDRSVSDFESLRPAVVVLAFDKLEAAQSYRNRLYRSSRLAHVVPHRTIVLCSADELSRVYCCCKSGMFDDYVLLWPETLDRPRLAMAIHHALHLLARSSPNGVSVGDFAAHARHFGSLEPKLAGLAHRFACEVEMTHAAASAAERSSGATFRQDFPRLCDSVDALCDAARAMARALGPQLKTARAMHELAKRVRPTVLAINDDVFEQTLLERLLANTKLDLICVSTGAQAFSSIWTRRPDLVLIDADLPDISGMEVIRRLKSVEPLADIPMIMATAHSQRAIVMESLKAGAADFIVKPFSRATLLGKFAAYLPAGVI